LTGQFQTVDDLTCRESVQQQKLNLRLEQYSGKNWRISGIENETPLLIGPLKKNKNGGLATTVSF